MWLFTEKYVGQEYFLCKFELAIIRESARVKVKVFYRPGKSRKMSFLKSWMACCFPCFKTPDQPLEELAKNVHAIPENVQKVIDKEKKNLDKKDFTAKTHLDWLTFIPWGITTEEEKNLAKIRDVLDTELFGCEDVKASILGYMASHGTGSMQGKVLCFVGPPGVGKTHIAKSLAQALNRSFFSVGVISRSFDVKGLNRSYVSQKNFLNVSLGPLAFSSIFRCSPIATRDEVWD